MTAETRHCCRMDDHTPHPWWGRQAYAIAIPTTDARVEFSCTGVRIHEGGFAPNPTPQP